VHNPTDETAAVPTLSGQSILVMASRHHLDMASAATVAIIVPCGSAHYPHRAAQHILHLDAAAARHLARHLGEYACLAEMDAEDEPQQTEREALDAAISGLVGLS